MSRSMSIQQHAIFEESDEGLEDIVKNETNKDIVQSSSNWKYRYVILSLVIVVKVALNFVFDIPGALEETITQVMRIDVSHYNLFYSIYSWPTVISTFLLGMLTDRFLGLRLGALVFITIATMGHLLFTIGGYFDSFAIMVVARFISGIGGDTALAVTDALCSVWFKGREVTFMIAMLGFGCRLGGALSLFSNPFIYDKLHFISNNHTRLGLTLTAGFVLCIIGFISTVIIFIVDKKAEKQRSIITRQPFKWKDVTEFGIVYWLAVGGMVTFFGSIFPFVAIAQVFLVSKYRLSVSTVSISETSLYIASLTSPLAGLLINWTGYNVYWGLTALHLTLGVHLLYFFSNGSSYIPLIGNIVFGICHAFFNSSMWVTPVYLVSEHQIATAFGLGSSLINGGLAVTDLLSGYLIDHHGYFIEELLFVCFVSFGILLLYLMVFVLAGKNHQVNMSGRERRRLSAIKNSNNDHYNIPKPTSKYKTF